MMSVLRQIFLIITFITSCVYTAEQNDKTTKPLTPSNDGSDLNAPSHQRTFHLSTYVVNIFPDINVSAFILFEQDRVSRLHYGNVQHFNATMEPHSDFIIQFRQIPTDGKNSPASINKILYAFLFHQLYAVIIPTLVSWNLSYHKAKKLSY